MDVVSLLINSIIWLVNKTDGLLSLLGIKLFQLSKETILKGLPDGAAEELQKPDVKLFADALLGDTETLNKMNLVSRLQWRSILSVQIKSRILIKETIERIPDILNVPIKKPVFIIGPMRTGTTFLQWLMACDKQFRSPMCWEQMSPCPPGPVEDFKKDPRYVEVEQISEVMKRINPGVYGAHPIEPDKPEECLLLLGRSLMQALFIGVSKPITDAFLDCDKNQRKHTYEYFKLQLQVLGWGHGMESRYYLGKAFIHLLNIDGLVELFPEARFIFTYRPLSDIVPSFLSMTKHYQDPEGYNTDTKEWMDCTLRFPKEIINRGVRNLDEIQRTHKDVKVYYLPYKDLVSDPLGEVRKIYDALDLTLTPETESAMINYLQNDPKKTVYGKHKYKEGVTLSKEYLETEYKEYIEIMSKRADRKYLL